MAHENPNHDYHIIPLSPLPIMTSLAFLLIGVSAVLYMNDFHHSGRLLIVAFAFLIACLYYWWRRVVIEAAKEKAHTKVVQNGLRLGMALFILSEVMFFFAFFFSYFSSFFHTVWFETPLFNFDTLFLSDSPPVWPPAGIITFDPWDLPLFNTIILLLSGTTVTWAHWGIMNNDRKALIHGLAYSVALGVLFTILQAYEYSHAAFSIDTNNYSSNFFLATGFHGFHVIVGTAFLAVCLIRAIKGQMDSENHLGFEFAAWYWHFVDVVWLFLFVVVYWVGQ